MTNNTSCQTKYVMKDIPPEYVLDIQGAKFIRLSGLLYLASQQGVFKCETKDVSVPDTDEITYECKGYLIPSDSYLASKGFSLDNPLIDMFRQPTITHGTTNPENLKAKMVPFRSVMAETRAIARCLRIITECPYCSLEELGNYNFSAEEAIATAKSAGIELKSASDMLNEPQHEPKTRAQFIECIGKLKSKKGVSDVIKAYLGQNNALVVENLNDAKLRELYNSIIQFLAE